MDDALNIYVFHLTDGHQEKIEKTLPPTFLAVYEEDLVFQQPVIILGEAEVADGILILKLAVQTEATIPCMICNKGVQVKISFSDFCHIKEMTDIEKGIFNFSDILREEILLALPSTAECNGGNCPEREVMAKYFSNNKEKDPNRSLGPFEDL